MSNNVIIEDSAIENSTRVKLDAYRILNTQNPNFDEENGVNVIFIIKRTDFPEVKVASQDNQLTPMNEVSEIGKSITIKEFSRNLVILSPELKFMEHTLIKFKGKYFEPIAVSDSMDPETKRYMEADSNREIEYTYTFSEVQEINKETHHTNIYVEIDSEDIAEELRRNEKTFSFSGNTEIHKFKALNELNQNQNNAALVDKDKTFAYPVAVYEEDVLLTTFEPWRDITKVLPSSVADTLFKKTNQEFLIADLFNDADIQKTYYNCLAMAQASITGFAGYVETDHVADILVKNVVSVETPTCVDMALKLRIRNHPAMLDNAEWPRFIATMYSSSSFMAHTKYCHDRGFSEDHKVLLPYFLTALDVAYPDTDTSGKKNKIKPQANIKLRIDSTFLNKDFTPKETFYKKLSTETPIFTDKWLKTKVMSAKLTKEARLVDSASLSDSSDGLKAYIVFSRFADIKKYLDYSTTTKTNEVSHHATQSTITKNGYRQKFTAMENELITMPNRNVLEDNGGLPTFGKFEYFVPANKNELQTILRKYKIIPATAEIDMTESKGSITHDYGRGGRGGFGENDLVYSWDIVYKTQTTISDFIKLTPVVDNHEKAVQSAAFGRTPISVTTSANKIAIKALRMQSMSIQFKQDDGTTHIVSIPLETGKDESIVEKTVRL